ncbi:MAG: M13 family metallopeptidase [Bacteroidales bacterium]|jgi:putative endopeptidase|nr:M13 family metallopeptidase [Bacteroidales bacterium]MDD4770343.1 M13 family metallopeptidase [Bacteroidales bacterium]
MKHKLYYMPLLFAAMAAGCSQKPASNPSDAGLSLSHMDTLVAPGADFYRFATGGWSDSFPIPDEYARYGSFDQLRENNQKQIHELFETLSKEEHPQGSVAQKIADFFNMGMDEATLNANGAKPIETILNSIRLAETRSELIRLAGEIRVFAVSPFMGMYVGADDKNSSMNILHVYQAGLGLGDRDYYLEQDDHSKELRKGYIQLMETQFVHAGFSNQEAQSAAQSVIQLETQLAQAHMEKEKTRIPELNYHKMSVQQLNASVAELDWNLLLSAAGIESLDSLNVGQPEAIAKAAQLLNQADASDVKAYLSWCVINGAASYLSDDFYTANFEFYGKQLSGKIAPEPRWKRVVNTVDGSLSEAVGQMYVEKYFPASAKTRMLELVENLKGSLGERIRQLTWMRDETKAKAQEKLSTFIVKVGYPDTWRSYEDLNVQKDSYWANVVRSSQFEHNYQLSKLGKPVDKNEWLMSPQTVNAYYNPTTNEICFPAGILQPPFFYMEGDDAINYGAIGVVIGHEMTHGFDDQGRKYDLYGNMTDWWNEADAANFEQRAQVLVDCFDRIEVVEGVHANGQFTLGENIADHGGLQISYQAFTKTQQGASSEPIQGYTPQQRFFLAYAMLWAGNVRDEEKVRLTKIDPHSLGRWRVNGALPHINAWYEAFGIAEKDSMFIPVEARASIW